MHKEVKVRVFTTLDDPEDFSSVLEDAIFALAFYDDYFKTPFPLKKLDLIVPTPISNAVSLFGLIYLIDKNREKTYHEVCHQWVGFFFNL